jgi:hypothetical protein
VLEGQYGFRLISFDVTLVLSHSIERIPRKIKFYYRTNNTPQRCIALNYVIHDDCTNLIIRFLLSLQDMFHPLPNYRNPCWRETLDESTEPFAHNSYCKYLRTKCDTMQERYQEDIDNGIKSRLRCLPYFYFVGVTKAGTTDLKYQISKHPDIVRPFLSEINWWNRRRQGIVFTCTHA